MTICIYKNGVAFVNLPEYIEIGLNTKSNASLAELAEQQKMVAEHRDQYWIPM